MQMITHTLAELLRSLGMILNDRRKCADRKPYQGRDGIGLEDCRSLDENMKRYSAMRWVKRQLATPEAAVDAAKEEK